MINERIRRARLLRGMTLQQVADQIGDISKQAISKYESGQDTPSSTRLLQLARAFGVKTEYFFRPDTVQLGNVDFRKKARLNGREQEAIKEQVRDHLERYFELEAMFDSQLKVEHFSFRKTFRAETPEDAEAAANQLRERMSLGCDAIRNLTELLEDSGLKVINIAAHDDFDGMMAEVKPQDEAIVIINSRQMAIRQRFTLAHELGHIVMDIPHHIDEKLEEKLCHRFAGAFLFPKERVIEEFGEARTKVLKRELTLASEAYGLSMPAIIRRLFDLNIIPEISYEFWNKYFRRNRSEEANVGAPEESHRFEGLVYRGLAEGIFTQSKAAEFLGMSTSDLGMRLTEEASENVGSSDL